MSPLVLYSRFAKPSTIVLLSLALACSGAETGDRPAADSISLTATNVELMWIGAVLQVHATPLDRRGSAIAEESVAWSSSDPNVASVRQVGNFATITGHRVGSATVRAESGQAAAGVAVLVHQVPAEILKLAGDGQQGGAARELDGPLVIQVNDAGGTPIEGVAVSFSVADDGSLNATSASSDARGRATTTWRLGTKHGEQRVDVTVSSGHAEATFGALAAPGPAVAIALASLDEQRGTQGVALSEPLRVRVSDRFGNPVEGHAITWLATSGGGVVDPQTSTTDAKGEAQAVWTLGAAGPQRALAVEANLSGSPIAFSATARKPEGDSGAE
jgi:hypothetical protein